MEYFISNNLAPPLLPGRLKVRSKGLRSLKVQIQQASSKSPLETDCAWIVPITSSHAHLMIHLCFSVLWVFVGRDVSQAVDQVRHSAPNLAQLWRQSLCLQGQFAHQETYHLLSYFNIFLSSFAKPSITFIHISKAISAVLLLFAQNYVDSKWFKNVSIHCHLLFTNVYLAPRSVASGDWLVPVAGHPFHPFHPLRSLSIPRVLDLQQWRRPGNRQHLCIQSCFFPLFACFRKRWIHSRISV